MRFTNSTNTNRASSGRRIEVSDATVLERGLSMELIAEDDIPPAILAKLSPWPKRSRER